MIFDCNEVISERLWVGRYVEPENVRHLTQLGITTVVSLQSDEDLRGNRIRIKKMQKAYLDAGIELIRSSTPDFDVESLLLDLPRCVEALEAAMAPRGSRVYLHCTAGMNRSPTVAAAFLMRANGFHAKEAYQYVKARRHCMPYLHVLERYETSVRDVSS